MNEKIIGITPPKLPFNPDDKIFQSTDDEGNIVGDPYSYNDFIKQIENISGISDSLLGNP